MIYSVTDDWGEIQVLDDGQFRTLSFGKGDEQSKIRLAAPYVLQHEYTQAMLLALLLHPPKRVTILGLGGGCLLSALHHHIPGVHLTAVELRQAVIDVAERYFPIPKGKKIHILNQEAGEFLAAGQHKKSDLLFTDIYQQSGMDPIVLLPTFIAQCAKQIKSEGWLVLNCWAEYENNTDLLDALKTHFCDIRALNTGSGNWVVLAGKQRNTLNHKQLKQDAMKWSSRLGFPMGRHLSRLKMLHPEE